MRVADFDFHLPPHLIAQSPPPVRGDSRMLLLNRHTGALADHLFTDLPHLLQPGDLLVLNDSRVIPARLFAQRLGLHTQKSSQSPSALVEVLLTQQLDTPHTWSALVRPAKKVPVGETLLFPDPSGHPPLRAHVTAEGPFGQRTLHFLDSPDLFAALDRIGHLPLPPYIHRTRTQPNTPQDRERYQTVVSSAATRGSAAAPTAGLHFTPQVLAALTDRGVHLATVTLHVGLGTFQPVRVEHLSDIRLHAEPYTLPAATADALNLATREGRRILAVGTTTTRTLEHVARTQSPGNLTPHTGSTALFLSPGSPFHLVQGLLTNFHLPQSTLLMLVSAFAGREPTLRAYYHAIAHHYRFFSYGDCMLLL